MTTGMSFTNGSNGVRVSAGFHWGERLTVVRRDTMSYGTERFVVRNDAGRHGYAYL